MDDETKMYIHDQPRPRYAHDCVACRFLGWHGSYDLYYCDQGGTAPTVIARWSSEPSAYLSGLSFTKPRGDHDSRDFEPVITGEVNALRTARQFAEKAGCLPSAVGKHKSHVDDRLYTVVYRTTSGVSTFTAKLDGVVDQMRRPRLNVAEQSIVSFAEFAETADVGDWFYLVRDGDDRTYVVFRRR